MYLHVEGKETDVEAVALLEGEEGLRLVGEFLWVSKGIEGSRRSVIALMA